MHTNPLASLRSKAICRFSNNMWFMETCSCHGNDVICKRCMSMCATVSKFEEKCLRLFVVVQSRHGNM